MLYTTASKHLQKVWNRPYVHSVKKSSLFSSIFWQCKQGIIYGIYFQLLSTMSFNAPHPFHERFMSSLLKIYCFRYDMMTSSNGNIFRVTGNLCGECTGHRWIPRTKTSDAQSFDVFFDLRMNKRLSKQWWGWWFETPSRPLWRQSNDSNDPIVSQINTYHDSSAVVICINLWHDQIIIGQVRATWILHDLDYEPMSSLWNEPPVSNSDTRIF